MVSMAPQCATTLITCCRMLHPLKLLTRLTLSTCAVGLQYSWVCVCVCVCVVFAWFFFTLVKIQSGHTYKLQDELAPYTQQLLYNPHDHYSLCQCYFNNGQLKQSSASGLGTIPFPGLSDQDMLSRSLPLQCAVWTVSVAMLCAYDHQLIDQNH